MSMTAVEKPAWGHIDTVLLDLDGTLLDLAYDNHFWLEIVPVAYAAARSTTVEAAREVLAPRFRACEGTLPWYCIDHWSRELDLDIEGLKRAHTERIGWLPGAEGFLQRLRAAGKRVVLLTNGHPQVVRIKHEKTGVLAYFDAVFSSHEFGVPKESARFWEDVRAKEPFDPGRSLFADDSPAVLRAAQGARIRWVYGIRCPDSVQSVREHVDVASVDSVSELV
ncbi:MAG TPA: GMP/IMP nucleotidase [Steroidobacteraceae bacterium]|nr:GMP/IMP nucleotidase [Steroidobacteraceae bacterium]